MENNRFKIRDLCTDDIFPICDIIGKCGIAEFKNCFLKNPEQQESNREAGINIVFEMAGIICRNISSCKNELYSFLSGISEMTEEEIRKLLPSEFINLLKVVLTKKEIKDFFMAVSGLFISG